KTLRRKPGDTRNAARVFHVMGVLRSVDPEALRFMGRMARVDRRDFLKLGAVGAGAPLVAGCRSSGLELTPGASVDLATAAQLAYRGSLKSLKRSLPLPDGTERAEAGTGTLAADHALLRGARGSRPGRAD